MSIRDLAWDVGALAAALALGLGIGYVRGDAHGYAHGMAVMNPKVLAAQQAQARAEGETALSKDALGKVKAKLAKQQADMQAASARAAQALKDRDALTQRLAAANRQRLDHDRKTLHENDCAALARLPVCPQLARRLFGAPAKTDAARAPAGH